MLNNALVERVHQLREAVRTKNPSFAGTLAQTIITLLEYKGQLATASKDQLMAIKGINAKNADYFLRLFQGESIDSVADSIPANKPFQMRSITQAERYAQKETGNWDGSWDNIVDSYENRNQG